MVWNGAVCAQNGRSPPNITWASTSYSGSNYSNPLNTTIIKGRRTIIGSISLGNQVVTIT